MCGTRGALRRWFSSGMASWLTLPTACHSSRASGVIQCWLDAADAQIGDERIRERVRVVLHVLPPSKSSGDSSSSAVHEPTPPLRSTSPQWSLSFLSPPPPKSPTSKVTFWCRISLPARQFAGFALIPTVSPLQVLPAVPSILMKCGEDGGHDCRHCRPILSQETASLSGMRHDDGMESILPNARDRTREDSHGLPVPVGLFVTR